MGTGVPAGPACPQCGGPMRLRTAKRGPNRGSQFWGCTGFPTCKGTVNVGGLQSTATTGPSGGIPVSAFTQFDQARPIVAGSMHRGMETEYFELMTVPESELSRMSEARRDEYPHVGAQWRLSYARPQAPQLDEASLRALSVVAKLIFKGRLTLLSQGLEELLLRPSLLPNRVVPLPNTPDLDSDEERLVWNQLLPELLGPAVSNWVTPQVELWSLTMSSTFVATGQRVDFVISHPALPRPLVLEVDGAQHVTQQAQDRIRDAELAKSGYEVLRIPASEVRSGIGVALDACRGKLAGLDPMQPYSDRMHSPIRRAGQIQATLLHAMIVGLLPFDRAGRVSTDLISAGEITESEFAAIVADFVALAFRVGRLYDVEIFKDGLATQPDHYGADLTIQFYGPETIPSAVLVQDTFLPIRPSWPAQPAKPGLPVSFDRESLEFFLNVIFRKPQFRDGQFEIVSRALQAKDTVALLPTGAGKSIAFQLAGLLLPGRTVVVAPITSLIRDQVQNLQSYGIDRALGITSEQSTAGRSVITQAYQRLTDGQDFFYYTTPERFQMAEFRKTLRGMTAAYPVNMIVIDEAHCVSEWGHDFRTAYLRIGQTARGTAAFAGWTPSVVALTGTASRAVLRDLRHELRITDFDSIITPATFDREELEFEILPVRSQDKQVVLASFLTNRLSAHFGLQGAGFFRLDGRNSHCGLIFCPNVNGPFGVVEVAKNLNQLGIGAEYYSGSKPTGVPSSQGEWDAYKRKIEHDFRCDKMSVLVTTKAFGMGIDKPNIRFTVHFGIPPSIEAFYQEAGRAGRDGRKAMCTAIVSDDRTAINRQMLAPATSIDDVRQFVQQTQFPQNDDVTRALFFHVKSFAGIQQEIAFATGLLADFQVPPSGGLVTIGFGADQQSIEKALHRLVVVGIVEDYTVDYSAKSFDVHVAITSRSKVIEKYCAHVSGYQSGRAAQERKKAEALPTDWDGFVGGVVGLYVQFVYDVIERGQRRAIAEMLAACQAGSGEELRRRILAHLEQDTVSGAVEAILAGADAGLGVVPLVLAEVLSPDHAAALRGPVARALETYPDHPGLLLARAASEILSRDCDEETVAENFRAFLTNSKDAYGLSEAVVASATGSILSVVAHRNARVSLHIETAFLREYVNREAIRSLIREAGVTAARVAPWLLLEALVPELEGVLAHSSTAGGLYA